MKRPLVFAIVLILTLAGGFFSAGVEPVSAWSPLLKTQQVSSEGTSHNQAKGEGGEGVVQGYYFYADDCPHCITILDELILPTAEDFGSMLDIRLLEISNPYYYETMLLVESYFEVASAERSIPTLVIGNEILIGESEIRERFIPLVTRGIETGGLPLPTITGVDPETLTSVDPNTPVNIDETCETDEGCTVDAPIYVAYFYQTGCKECSRVEVDLNYLKSQYPQMQVVEFNIYEHADLATWMVERLDYSGDFNPPALFIGEEVLMADAILPDRIIDILEEYSETGAEPVWLNFDPEEGQRSIIERFRNMGWLAVVAAGLVDGINPCAFATLIFFVSYLTLSGRRGNEVLKVGGAFTLGVFLAYLAVGMGLYRIIEMVGSTLDVIARIVYIITGIFCVVLAGFSFMDYKKAKQGEVGDMLLKLPEPLRKRINTTIRKGRSSRNYVLGAFGAGILISFLELACTGQVYLPTIIFVSSIPDLRLQAIFYLVLYNLLFILPLIVIFVLVYYGTTSKDLTRFLQEKAAAVKFSMGIVFVALGGWLLLSLFI